MRTVAGVTSANERCPKVDRICLSKQGSIELTGPRLEVMVGPATSQRTDRTSWDPPPGDELWGPSTPPSRSAGVRPPATPRRHPLVRNVASPECRTRSGPRYDP